MKSGVNDIEIIVYAPLISQRLSYITQVLLPGCVLTADSDFFLKSSGCRINYSDKFFDDIFRIVPHGLLFEQGTGEQEIYVRRDNNLPVFFETGGDLGFDFFAASFYLLSRYEEYLPYTPDQYGRYPHEASLAYRENFLDRPLINEWLELLQEKLSRFYGNHSRFTIDDSRLTLHHSRFSFIPTYDVDEAFSYLHKPLWKNILGFYRDLLQGKFEAVVERGNVYSGRKPDPYDTFGWLDQLHATYSLQPVYFFLTIVKRGEYDKNLPASSHSLQHLYQRLSQKYATGLHPSWQSGTDEWLLEKELETLKEITGARPLISRNHYLRFTVPHTYRRLIAAGISDDYSMAYGAANGFRASYALPFRWYDLEKETITELTIHSFCFMEAASFFSLGYSATEAGEELQYYHDIVKKVNGEFITLFHNHFLTEQPQWIAWREMYAAFLQKNFG